jgi:hypothetical protein
MPGRLGRLFRRYEKAARNGAKVSDRSTSAGLGPRHLNQLSRLQSNKVVMEKVERDPKRFGEFGLRSLPINERQ